MKFVSLIIGILLLASSRTDALDLGVGISSSMDGRTTPGLLGSMDVTNEYIVSATSAGVQTEAYFHNSYTLSFMKKYTFPKLLFGTPHVGFGIGGHYGIREYLMEVGEGGQPEVLAKDEDYNLGPAFRIAIYPFGYVFMGFEYVMGLGPGILGLGFADIGMFVLGVSI